MRLRMADEDREKYGGPEELDFGDVPAWLDNLGYDDLVALEDQIRADLQGAVPARPGEEKTLLWALDQLISRTREASALRMVRIRVWLALRAGGIDIALADFKPARLYGVRVVRPERDAVPPAGKSDSSPTSSSESDATTSTSTSANSTDASTPGPDASTT